jgi:hypothetical protein
MQHPLRRASKRPPEVATFAWRDYTLRIVHTPDVVNVGWSHLQVVVLEPTGAPLPLGFADTLALELDEDEICAAGGTVALLTTKLDAAARFTAYAQAVFRWRQGKLL